MTNKRKKTNWWMWWCLGIITMWTVVGAYAFTLGMVDAWRGLADRVFALESKACGVLHIQPGTHGSGNSIPLPNYDGAWIDPDSGVFSVCDEEGGCVQWNELR